MVKLQRLIWNLIKILLPTLLAGSLTLATKIDINSSFS